MGITIDKLIFNGIEYHIGIPAIISSASENFWISDDLYKLFEDTILKEAIDKQLCQIVETSNIRYITCSLSELGNTTSLIINNILFTFSYEFFGPLSNSHVEKSHVAKSHVDFYN